MVCIIAPYCFQCCVNTAHQICFRVRLAGWQEGGVNSLEIYEGVTSLGTMIKKYTTDNFTAGDMLFSSGEGLYIRLRGVFNMADSLKMIFTGVNNYTNSKLCIIQICY